MDELLRILLQESGLKDPPEKFNDDFYEWLAEAQGKVGVCFVSSTPLAHDDLALLVRMLGDVPAELQSYYSKSTPWDYGVEEYLNRMKYIRTECLERLVSETGMDDKEINFKLTESKPLWPVEIYNSSNSALAFSDHAGRLAIISCDIRGGLGRPLSIGLRNYFVMRVITQLAWYETDGEKSYAEVGCRSEISTVGEWPQSDTPNHLLIDYFNLMTKKNK